jgi:hypothetical protein
MATRSSSRPGLGEAARQVADHATTIVRLELRLALQEVSRKVRKLGVGGGLMAGAGAFVWIALLCGVGAGIAAIALVLPVWASLLIVCGGLVLLSGLLGTAGLLLLKRATPPVPEQAIREAKLTTEALKNGRH